jgi:hypothetical protein
VSPHLDSSGSSRIVYDGLRRAKSKGQVHDHPRILNVSPEEQKITNRSASHARSLLLPTIYPFVLALVRPEERSTAA